MLRVLVPLLILALTVYCLVDSIQTDESEVRNLPKVLWIIIILLFTPIGGIAWLIAGRPRSILPGRGGKPPSQRPRGPRGPDDDPDFLRGL